MNALYRILNGLILLTAGISFGNASQLLPPNLSPPTAMVSHEAWPVMPPQPLPKGLRPCCAFGYNLHTELLGLPVPLWQLNNVATVDDLGQHHYNDRLLAGLESLIDLNSEHNGILYTSRGGFVDTAHVRDTADMTVYIFSQLMPRLGQPLTLYPGKELAERRLVFNAFTPPESPAERYTLAAWLAAHLAFQIAAWHEIAQWYGFRSVPGFSEEVSAFSPEDLYSNLLGARLAVSLILDGQTATSERYNAAMSAALSQTLVYLGAQPAKTTRFQFDMLDGNWWDSRRRVPEKYLLLRRNYQLSDSRLPTPVPGEQTPPLYLSLPHRWQTFDLDALAQLQLWPTANMARLPPPARYYTAADFPALAAAAQREDERTAPHSAPARETPRPDGE